VVFMSPSVAHADRQTQVKKPPFRFFLNLSLWHANEQWSNSHIVLHPSPWQGRTRFASGGGQATLRIKLLNNAPAATLPSLRSSRLKGKVDSIEDTRHRIRDLNRGKSSNLLTQTDVVRII
jgi:hypothetical protein